MYYTFKKKDSGIYGKAFEMAVKDALHRKNADRVSPCGKSDFTFNRKHYDTKQNGSPINYGNGYIKGSSRVIYASHIAYTIIEENDEMITLSVDLEGTSMFCVERGAFVEFLLENGYAKNNTSRGTINVQTGYNYSKECYHGKVGKIIEEWCYENEDDPDDIIGAILEGLI